MSLENITDRVHGMDITTQDILDKRLKNLLKRYTTKQGKICEMDGVYYDLGLFGDDSDESIQEYSQLFNVDISSMYLNEYFPNEGVPQLNHTFRILLGKPRKQYKNLRVCDLMKGIKTHKLE